MQLVGEFNKFQNIYYNVDTFILFRIKKKMSLSLKWKR